MLHWPCSIQNFLLKVAQTARKKKREGAKGRTVVSNTNAAKVRNA